MNSARQEAKSKLRKAKKQILHSDGLFYTLLRSSVSSQVCGWIDTLTAFFAFSLLHLTPFLSTAIGAFIGGVLNCAINYRFTFHAYSVNWRIALFKFSLVWAGSLLLNSYGTQVVYYLVKDNLWLQENVFMISNNGTFLASRLFVALMVSLFWNFLLQRHFVFKVTRLDLYIDRILTSRRKDKTSENGCEEADEQ